MKLTFLLAVTFLCLNLWSSPVPQTQLDRMNALLSMATSDNLSITLTDAERDDTTGKVTNINTKTFITTDEGLDLTILLELTKEQNSLVNITGSATTNSSSKIINNRNILMIMTLSQSLVRKINDEGNYEATIDRLSSKNKSDIAFSLRPILSDDQYIQEIKVIASVPKKEGTISISFDGTLKTDESIFKILTQPLPFVSENFIDQF